MVNARRLLPKSPFLKYNLTKMTKEKQVRLIQFLLFLEGFHRILFWQKIIMANAIDKADS